MAFLSQISSFFSLLFFEQAETAIVSLASGPAVAQHSSLYPEIVPHLPKGLIFLYLISNPSGTSLLNNKKYISKHKKTPILFIGNIQRK